MDKRGIVFVLFSLLVLTFVVSAAELPSWKDRYVNDFGGIFSENQTSELRNSLIALEQDTTAEIVVVTDNECASKGGQSKYASDLLSGWGVGKKEKNNGLLVLYCKEEKKIFVATGYGLEGILPDSKIGRMLDETYVPLRDSGDINGGILSFVSSAISVVEENKGEVLAGTAGGDSSDSWRFIILLLFFIIIVILTIIKNKRVCKKDGLKMKRIGRKGNHYIYKCPHGHIEEITIAAATGYLIAHGLSSGMRGGGGGGFGGGGGGGGGAGR